MPKELITNYEYFYMSIRLHDFTDLEAKPNGELLFSDENVTTDVFPKLMKHSGA